MGSERVSAMLALAVWFALAACSGGDGELSDPPAPTTTVPAATTTVPAATTTTVVETTSTTTPPVPDAECVYVVRSGDSLGAIAATADGLTVDDLRRENRLADGHVIHPDDELDICIGNDLDDVTGASRLAPEPAAVRRQQTRLNELFEGYSIAQLTVDGDSGPLTRQLLCAARIGLGLPASTAHLAAGGVDEQLLFDAERLSIPDGAGTWSNRWAHIDKTCQVMFTGEGEDRIVDVFPVSTGEAGFETHDLGGAAAFRYDPALDNGGWHDSSRFPVEIDNPLNGNMYKPIYFNGCQAIHGAGYVPPTPQSKGCARTFPWHHDRLIAWLGLGDVTEATWQEDTIGLVVTVVGDYRPLD